MHLKLVSFLCVLFLAAGSFGSASVVSSSEVPALQSNDLVGNDLHGFNPSPSRRSLLSVSNGPKTDLIATVDGNIHLVELKTGKVFWSFASGPPIYSSYQDPVEYDNDKGNFSRAGSFFIDCGDDWKLYMHGAFGKQSFNEKIGDFISKTPLIADDGGVVLGSKRTSVFLVDAKTGNLIYDYNLSDSPRSPGNYEQTALNASTSDKLGQSGALNLKPEELPLYITRTDYSLKSFVLNTDRVLWNLTVSDIWAAFLCQDIENSAEGIISDSGYQFPSKAGARFNLPLPCQSKLEVIRFRRHDMLGPLFELKMLPEAPQDMKALPGLNKLPYRKSEADKLSESYHKDEKLPLPASDTNQDNDTSLLPSLPQMTEKSGIYLTQNDRTDSSHGRKMPSNLSGYLFYFVMVLVIAGFPFVFKKYAELNVKSSNLNARVTASKKKKNRKSGKSNGLAGKRDENTSSDDGLSNRPWMMLNDSIDKRTDGRSIGKLFVSNQEIAKGSNGTIVLEGVYEGRVVAVKRLVKAHHDVAFKEIQNLIASDSHANIVRWYGVESDQDFVYLSLERCTCSLGDLIKMHTDTCEKPSFTVDRQTEAMINYKIRVDSMKDIVQDVKLWKDNGNPSCLLLRLMRDVVSGLVHLHELGIVHRDLKPQNVLIIKERSLCAKLSDMGISKRLVGDMSSLGHHATGAGSSGWQAPEQLLQGRQTRAVDMFSLGCVLFYCITGGRHPYGDHLERDINIAKNRVDLFLVEHIPEAVDLFSHLLDPNAELRPKASEVLLHPLFWNSETRLSFFRDASDRVELEDREASSSLLKALESTAPVALGTKWDEKMEPAFITSIGQYRRYKFDSVRDLLRVMRNKLNHYRELPAEIKEILGAVPEGFEEYFSSRFPKLLIEVYKVMYIYCKEEECFSKYFKGITN